ncbi:hypothetical protein FBU59_000054 [Linderina macrospora]|uniref:Uncharacterized protein n=1 Tax=Linderina macrospora TaxID=4868 RepID=A0ACC1JHV0_9FUNG|nr:hypothetical protein FBU59_000054 [Linderina macrospora]
MVVDEWLQLQRVVIRGTDLFVAVGGEIRWINLQACKDAYVGFESKHLGVKNSIDGEKLDSKATSQLEAVQHVPWYRVLGEALGFEIRRLVCNKSGKLLAAVGQREVAVVTLPSRDSPVRTDAKRAFSVSRGDKSSGVLDAVCVNCASKAVSALVTAGRRGRQAGEGVVAARARVADVLWHPMSSSDSHLVVLLSSGVVKVFDVLADVSMPEQTISLGSAAAGNSGYSDSQAVSLCMGSGASGWVRLTLFVLMNTGELYSLCPVLPRTCTLERPWLEQLLDIAEMDICELQPEEYESRGVVMTPVGLMSSRDAKEWLVNVLDLEPGKALMRATLSEEWLRPPVAQGPYLYQPDPTPVEDLTYDSDSDSSSSDVDFSAEDASDMVYLDTGDVGIVAISYRNAHVHVFADLEPVMGRWRQPMRGTAPAPPALTTLANVDLTMAPLAPAGEVSDSDSIIEEPRPSGAVSLVADPLCSSSLLAMHAQGAHRIDTRKWAALLVASMSADSEQEKNQALKRLLTLLSCARDEEGKKLLQRGVQCVVQTNSSASLPSLPVVGGVVLGDSYLAHSILFLVAPCKLVGATILLPEQNSGDEESDDSDYDADEEDDVEKSRKVLEMGGENVKYVTRLPLPVYTAPNESDLKPSVPRLVMSEEDDGQTVNEKKLDYLGTIVGQLRAQLAKVAHEHQKMELRVDLQTQEHERQCEKLREISKGFASHFKQLGKAQERLSEMQVNKKKTAMRLDQLLRLLVAHYQPVLTQSEQALARDITSVQGALANPGGMAEQIDELQERLGRLMNRENVDEQQTAGRLSQATVLTLETRQSRQRDALKKGVEQVKALSQRVALVNDAN